LVSIEQVGVSMLGTTEIKRIFPLHPQAFSLVWSLYQNLRASEILPGGIAVPYLLVPAALLGTPEWAAHLTTLVCLLISLYATAVLGLRLGFSEWEARWVTLMVACGPAVLGMAGTVMPDVPAMMFAAVGMERVAAWREGRKWHQGLAAAISMALAASTRSHTMLMVVPAAVLLLDGITREEIQASLTRFPWRFAPLVLAPILAFALSRLTADPEQSGRNLLGRLFDEPIPLHSIAKNMMALPAHFVWMVPLTIPWLILRRRHLSYVVLGIAGIGAVLASLKFGWLAYVAAASCVVLVDIAWDALRRGDRVQLALWVWLLLPIPVILYIHLPAKYLLPAAPAAAMLVMRLRPPQWALASVATAGAVLGILILLGTRDLAETQKRAAAELIGPYAGKYQRVWYLGHWGFHWYAEKMGAKANGLGTPDPQPGDIVVISQIDGPEMTALTTKRKVLKSVVYPTRYGAVMNKSRNAGFFSNAFGNLPWAPGSGEANVFEVWEIE
jgi:hypothetical protein